LKHAIEINGENAGPPGEPRSATPLAPDPHQRFFNADHLLVNLKGRTISSGLVTFLSQGAKFVLTVASTVIMARLLTLDDFGLVAMITAVTSVLRIFKDAGLSTATVQREGITHAQVSNLFWVNFAMSAALGLILAAASPLIARFYHEPRLIAMTLALSMTFVFSGSTVQHSALLCRQMRFKALAGIEIGMMIVTIVTGVVMALLGCRYWSLVGSTLAGDATGLVLTWVASGWRPQLPTRGSGTRSLLRFGVNLTAGNLIYTMARGADALLIGRRFGSASLGLYSRANGLLMRPIDQFLSPINAVVIPTLSRLQTQPERYRATFLRVFEMIALIGFPFSGLFLAVSHPLTLVLLGRKWESAAIIFGGFTLAALTAPLASSSTWLFTSQGRGRDALAASMINSIVVVGSFLAGLPYGPFGVALSFSISGLLIRLPILYYIVGRRGPVSTRDLWSVFFKQLPLWPLVLVATWLPHSLVSDRAPVVQLLVCVPVGLLATALSILALPASRRAALHLFKTLKSLRKPAGGVALFA
jgi:O-antigen/teichoic acid export membrane protein